MFLEEVVADLSDWRKYDCRPWLILLWFIFKVRKRKRFYTYSSSWKEFESGGVRGKRFINECYYEGNSPFILIAILVIQYLFLLYFLSVVTLCVRFHSIAQPENIRISSLFRLETSS